jgi:1-acyl-sn-glycerol-3-phosphate acyltransferase
MRRSLPNRLWQAYLKFLARLGFVAIYGIRCHGRQRVPDSGGGLVLSNHQSNLDPVIVGLASDRRLNYVARESLLRFAPLRWLLNSLDAIPIDRDGTGLSGLKETLKRLKRGEMVLIFPEGTRSPNGEVRPLKPGFCAIARRAAVPLVPVAVDGSFDAWPRYQLLPGRSVIHVYFGEPIPPSTIASLTDEQLLQEVERRIRACHGQAQRARQRAMGK